jgi:hypothetical protein
MNTVMLLILAISCKATPDDEESEKPTLRDSCGIVRFFGSI